MTFLIHALLLTAASPRPAPPLALRDRLHNAVLGVAQDPVSEHFEAGRMRGFAVAEVTAGTLYARLGMQPGDVLLDWDGAGVDSLEVLHALLVRSRQPGAFEVTVRRGDQLVDLREPR